MTAMGWPLIVKMGSAAQPVANCRIGWYDR
jgi:hypothetical protein